MEPEMKWAIQFDSQTDRREFKLMLLRGKKGVSLYMEQAHTIRCMLQFYRELSPYPFMCIFDLSKN